MNGINLKSLVHSLKTAVGSRGSYTINPLFLGGAVVSAYVHHIGGHGGRPLPPPTYTKSGISYWLFNENDQLVEPD